MILLGPSSSSIVGWRRNPGALNGCVIIRHLTLVTTEDALHGSPVAISLHMMRTALAAAVLLVARLAAAQSAIPSPGGPLLSVEEATTMAVAQSTDVRQAVLEGEKLAARIAQARARRLPLFDVRANASGLLAPIEFEFKRGVFGQDPLIGPVPSADSFITTPRGLAGFMVVSATQPLSLLHEIGLRIDLLEGEQLLQAERRRAVELDVAAQVSRLYSGIVSAEAEAASLAEARTLYREVERLVTELVNRDTALGADARDVRARVADTEYRELLARNAAATSRDQLNVVLGRSPSTPFAVAAQTEAVLPLPDLDGLVARALANRPELRQAELQTRQAAIGERVARAERLPEVAMQFTDMLLGNIAVLPTHVAALGVSVKWEFFDWGRRRSELVVSEKARAQADLALADARRRIEADVRSRHRRLGEARALIAVSRLAEEAALERLRLATVRQQRDTVLDREVLAAQATHAEALERVGRAVQAYWTAQAEIDRAVGGK
jgi:outer membrane protein